MGETTVFSLDQMEERSLLWLLPKDVYAEICQPDPIELLNSDIQNMYSYRQELLAIKTIDEIVNIDYCYDDPKLANDIYKHWKAYEGKSLPNMEKVRKNISTKMREFLIDQIVLACEICHLSLQTLYLTINYIDRYFSDNTMQMDQLQLVAVTCLMIAIKYEEEVHGSAMKLVLYLTDYAYSKEQIINMEETILTCLQYELGAPTPQCFLRRFIYAAQATGEMKSWGVLFEYLASFLMELSLYDYNMLCYAPSVIAASAVFLAKYVLYPNTPPWTATLKQYTEYEPYKLIDCVWHLYRLFSWNNFDNIAPTTKEKYSQKNYDFVAMVDFPPSIPIKYFS